MEQTKSDYIDSLDDEDRWEYLMGRQLAMESALGLLGMSFASGSQFNIGDLVQGASAGIMEKEDLPEAMKKGYCHAMENVLSALR